MRFLTASLFFIYSSCLSAQNVQYSHQIVCNQKKSDVQLIANVGPTHHLLILKRGGNPKIYVYNQSLQLKAQKEIPVKILKGWDVQIFSLRDYYYLFLQGTRDFQLWKIDENGSSSDMTAKLREFVKKRLLHDNVQLYLFTDSIHLHTLTITKKDSGQLQLRHVLFSEELATSIHHQINLPDTNKQESLQQATLIGDHHLLLLRSIVNNKEENILEVTKCNLYTGETEATRFNFYSRRILKPEMLFSNIDSTIIVHSIIVDAAIAYRQSVFISLIKKLRPDVVPGALPIIWSPFCYVFINGSSEHWFDYSNPSNLTLGYYKKPGNERDFSERMLGDSNSFANRVLVKGYTNPYGTSALYSPSTSSIQFYFPNSNSKRSFKDRFYFSRLQFLSIDRQNKPGNQTNFLNEKKGLEINPQETGIVQWKNKSLLLIKQIIRKNTSGLLMLYYNQQLKAAELSVYEHYDYLLPKARAANDGSIIIPYINKKETGLAKLHLDEIEDR